MGLSNRSMLASLGSYVAHQDYFVNEHHRAVFRQAFPRLYPLLFTNTQPGIQSLTALLREWAPVSRDHPEVARSLMPFIAARSLTLRGDPLWMLRGVSFGQAPDLMSLHRSWPAMLPL